MTKKKTQLTFQSIPKLLKIRISEPTYETLPKSKIWGANYKIGETCSKGQLPMILHRIIKNLRWFFDIWCNSVFCILWDKKGKPTVRGDSLRRFGDHTLIYRGDMPSGGWGSPFHGGELTKLGYIGWGIHFPHAPNPPPQRPQSPLLLWENLYFGYVRKLQH